MSTPVVFPFRAQPSWLAPSRASRALVDTSRPRPIVALRPEGARAQLGVLAEYAADPAVTDLFVNGADGLWVDRGQGCVREPGWTASEAEVRALAVHLIAAGGRHIDEATPAVDVRLGPGVRVHAVLPPLARNGTTLSVRLASPQRFTLDTLAARGFLTEEQHDTFLTAVRERWNVLITGAAGSGKTTMLSALLAQVPTTERIVILEDVAELELDHPNTVALEARQPNIEGAGRIGLDALLREALRMRPDRLVVGECRGAEVRELLAALNTGHDGGAGTLHANSLADVPSRLEALGVGAGLSVESLGRQVVSAFDLVVHLHARAGQRRVSAIGRFGYDGNGLVVTDDVDTTTHR